MALWWNWDKKTNLTNVCFPITFPSDSVAKNPPASAGDKGDMGSIPVLWRSPGGSCLGNLTEKGAWRLQFMGSQSPARQSTYTHTQIHLLLIHNLIPTGRNTLSGVIEIKWKLQNYVTSSFFPFILVLFRKFNLTYKEQVFPQSIVKPESIDIFKYVYFLQH